MCYNVCIVGTRENLTAALVASRDSTRGRPTSNFLSKNEMIGYEFVATRFALRQIQDGKTIIYRQPVIQHD